LIKGKWVSGPQPRGIPDTLLNPETVKPLKPPIVLRGFSTGEPLPAYEN